MQCSLSNAPRCWVLKLLSHPTTLQTHWLNEKVLPHFLISVHPGGGTTYGFQYNLVKLIITLWQLFTISLYSTVSLGASLWHDCSQGYIYTCSYFRSKAQLIPPPFLFHLWGSVLHVLYYVVFALRNYSIMGLWEGLAACTVAELVVSEDVKNVIEIM